MQMSKNRTIKTPGPSAYMHAWHCTPFLPPASPPNPPYEEQDHVAHLCFFHNLLMSFKDGHSGGSTLEPRGPGHLGRPQGQTWTEQGTPQPGSSFRAALYWCMLGRDTNLGNSS